MEEITYKNTKNYSDLDGITAFGKVVKVYDGDTIWVAIDFNNLNHEVTTIKPGSNIKKVKIRLARIDTPEIKGGKKAGKEKEEEIKNAKISRDYVSNLILNKNVLVKFGQLGKYLRPITEVFYYDEPQRSSISSSGNNNESKELINLYDELLLCGLAKEFGR